MNDFLSLVASLIVGGAFGLFAITCPRLTGLIMGLLWTVGAWSAAVHGNVIVCLTLSFNAAMFTGVAFCLTRDETPVKAGMRP